MSEALFFAASADFVPQKTAGGYIADRMRVVAREVTLLLRNYSGPSRPSGQDAAALIRYAESIGVDVGYFLTQGGFWNSADFTSTEQVLEAMKSARMNGFVLSSEKQITVFCNALIAGIESTDVFAGIPM